MRLRHRKLLLYLAQSICYLYVGMTGLAHLSRVLTNSSSILI